MNFKILKYDPFNNMIHSTIEYDLFNNRSEIMGTSISTRSIGDLFDFMNGVTMGSKWNCLINFVSYYKNRYNIVKWF